ncbi:TonB-dependent receptor [Oceanicoccus sagamiensis]|uniref:TonB-dependent receptor-like beta-barrel domain-containing protein n=1 Tax=Oceanicoccus sagamiensis TaxID=716816 RepID=A0A1X9N9Z6_9GAMM|nr:TonB-dependent receptor [Oceanicoccus sagamiensis]ARN73252.1 hypothetical protein BST96_03500 [Oceanicoccus sagamiensis]
MKSSETVLDIRLADIESLGLSWDAMLQGYEEDELGANGGMFFNWQKGDTNWIGGLEVSDRAKPEFIERYKYFPDGSLDYYRDNKTQEDGWNGKLTSTFGRSLASGSAFQVNGLYEDFTNKLNKNREQFQPMGDGLALEEDRTSAEQDKGYKWELGLDYDMFFSAQNTLKWQWIQNRSSSDFERLISESYLLSGDDDFYSQEDKTKRTSESILKGTLLSQPRKGFSSRSGLELVYNSLDQRLNLIEQGILTEDSDQGIAEERAEAFWFGEWQLKADLSFEVGSGVEYSQVRQNGDVRQQREFTYYKPEMELNYRPSPNDNWLFGMNRDVKQLNLADFANSVDDTQDEVRLANPDLEPEKSWQFRIQYERVFKQEKGNIKAKYYYHDVEDVVDQTPISEDESVLGNIGDGTRQGVVLDADIALAQNTRGTMNVSLLWTEVTDPFTGETRDFKDARDKTVTVELRQEFPRLHLPMTAGIIYYYKGSYENRRIDEINTISETEGYLDSYFEWQLPNKMNMRVDVKNLFDNTIETDRVNYALSIEDGTIESTELRERRLGRFWELTISGQI